jgi:hypothetical protein
MDPAEMLGRRSVRVACAGEDIVVEMTTVAAGDIAAAGNSSSTIRGGTSSADLHPAYLHAA